MSANALYLNVIPNKIITVFKEKSVVSNVNKNIRKDDLFNPGSQLINFQRKNNNIVQLQAYRLPVLLKSYQYRNAHFILGM